MRAKSYCWTTPWQEHDAARPTLKSVYELHLVLLIADVGADICVQSV